MEVHIAGTDAANSMLAHEYRCVSIVKQITGNPRNFCHHLLGNLRVSLGMNQYAESRRC